MRKLYPTERTLTLHKVSDSLHAIYLLITPYPRAVRTDSAVGVYTCGFDED